MNARRGPERRLNLLTGDWVLVSPQRLARPWRGAEEPPVAETQRDHDPACHLCAGVVRAGGARNPDYKGVFIFDNDFPALVVTDPPGPDGGEDILVREPESGVCRVIVYSPNHSRTMAQMSQPEILAVVEAWADQSRELLARKDVGAVIVFENRGAMMGASNPHPHGQIWTTRGAPNELAREDARQARWRSSHAEPMLAAYLRRELADGERIVRVNEHFVALVPFWAAWPFETLVLPRRSESSLDRLSVEEKAALAELLGGLTAGYDRLFATPFPYTMGIHQGLAAPAAEAHFTLHLHFYPPLLRSASVRKHMVGFEMLAMAQRDLTPEEAAARLRAVSAG